MIVEGETVEEVFQRFLLGWSASVGRNDTKMAIEQIDSFDSCNSCSNATLAALHTEGAEDGSEDGDDEIDYFLNHNAKIQHFSFPTHRCSPMLIVSHRLSLIGLCSISMILSHRNHDT